MKQRPSFGQSNSGRLRHCVSRDLEFRILQLPSGMVDVAAINALSPYCVQAITFGQPVRECSRLMKLGRTDGPVLSVQHRRGQKSIRGIVNFRSSHFHSHAGEKIWKMEERPRRPNGWHIRSVQAEEVHAWFVL